MTEKRFYMDKSGDLYDRENGSVMIDFGYSYDGVGCKKIIDLLNELHEKNKELQERNNRQAKQLGNIYHLIEKQDWKTLTGIIQEFKECEEQLQSEWKCYE